MEKASFECLLSLLDTCQEALDFDEFLQNIEPGFEDVYDVQILAFLILHRVAVTSPRALR